MKNIIFSAVSFALAATACAGTITRTANVPEKDEDGNRIAVFAVPNGYVFDACSVQRAACETGTDPSGETGTDPVFTVGGTHTVNGVELIPILVEGEEEGTDPLEITVSFADGGEVWTGLPSKIMRQYLRGYVANPEDIPTERVTLPGAKTALSVLPGGGQTLEGIDYLLLAPPGLVDAWTTYIEARKAAHPEVNFRLVNLADVYNDPDYAWDASASDGTPRNPAESIHKFLRTEARDHGVSYVVLGGAWIDASSIDSDGRWLYAGTGKPVRFENGEEMTLTNCVPGVYASPHMTVNSDQFFACLDLYSGDDFTQLYPWTSPSDQVNYFKLNGSTAKYFDNGPDLVVSRMAFLPAKNGTIETMIANYTVKLARGESADFAGQGRIGLNYDQFNRGVVGIAIGSSSMHTTEYEFYDDIINEFAENRSANYFVDTEPYVRRDAKRYISDYRPIWRTDGIGTYCSNIGNYFAQDRDLGTVCGHGVGGGSGAFTRTNYTNAKGLTLICEASNPCLTGYMDALEDEETTGDYHTIYRNLGEAAIGAANGGALVSFNNTRESWTAGHDKDTLSDRVSHRLCLAYGRDNANAGMMWLFAHYEYINRSVAETNTFVAAGTSTVEMMCIVEHVLFGDPLVQAQAPLYDAGVIADGGTFPHLASNVTFAAGAEIHGDGDRPNAVMFAHSGDGVTLTTADATAASHKTKITHRLDVAGTGFTFAGALEGGVGRDGVCFTGAAPGTLSIASTGRLYIAGVSNCAEVVVSGRNAILDVDNFRTNVLAAIRFTAPAGSTNVIRSVAKGALANVPVYISGGGTVKLETDDVFGGTTVYLSDDSSVYVGVDPKLGKRVNSTEPLRANFVGNGTVYIPYGTSETKKWTLSDGVATENIGELVTKLRYDGAIGASASIDWMSGSLSDAFENRNSKLGPGGFVHFVESKYPYFTADKANTEGFSLALYCDMGDVACGAGVTNVMLTAGNQSGEQLLLTMGGANRRIELRVTESGGAGRVNPDGPSIRYPGDGYHLYIIRYSAEGGLRLNIDGAENPDVIPSEDSPDYADFDFATNIVAESRSISFGALGIRIANQFGSLKDSLRASTGMAYAGLRGYDAILGDGEIAALAKEMPVIPASPELIMRESAVYGYAPSCTGTVVSATFPDGTYLGATKGYLYVPAGASVQVPALRFQAGSDATMNLKGVDIYGDITLTRESDETDVYAAQAAAIADPDGAGERMAGVVMGADPVATTYGVMNVYGTLDGSKSYFEINRKSASAEWVTIDGGTLKTKGIIDLSTNAVSQVKVTNGGTLEVASWPDDYGGAQRVKFILAGGTLKMAAGTGWSYSNRALACSGDNTIDVCGKDLSMIGGLSGSGLIHVTDTSAAKGGTIAVYGSDYGVDFSFTGILKLDASLVTENDGNVPAGWLDKLVTSDYTAYNYGGTFDKTEYSITYILNGAVTNLVPSVYYSYEPVTLAEIAVGAYQTFTGWYTNATLSGAAIAATDSSTSGDLTLYGTLATENVWVGTGGGSLDDPAFWTTGACPAGGASVRVIPTGEGETLVRASDGDWLRSITWSFATNVVLELTGTNINVESWIDTGIAKLIIPEGSTAVMSSIPGGFPVEVDGTYRLTITANTNYDNDTGTSRDLSAITGTGVMSLNATGSYWLAPPSGSRMWASTLAVEDNLAAGIVMTDTATNTIGTLSGSGLLRSDWSGTKNVQARYVRIIQARDSTWGGGFQSSDQRIKELRVCGAEGAGAKTLAISGSSNRQSCPLAVDATGSVDMGGTWTGNVTNEGRLSGTGQLAGSITFVEGSVYAAASAAQKNVTGTISGSAAIELGFTPDTSKSYNLIFASGGANGAYTLVDTALADAGWSVAASGQYLTLSWTKPSWTVKVDGASYTEEDGELMIASGTNIVVNGTFTGYVTVLSGGYDITGYLKSPFSASAVSTLTGTIVPELDPEKVAVDIAGAVDLGGEAGSVSLGATVRGLHYILEGAESLDALFADPEVDDETLATATGGVTLAPKREGKARFYRVRVLPY